MQIWCRVLQYLWPWGNPMNYIITWMEWVEITNNQKEFQTWTIAGFLASKMLLENPEKALFELGTYWCWWLLFVLWSTVACTWIVVVIWTMIKDFTIQFFISLHFTIFNKITSSCFVCIVYKHADAILRNNYFDSQVSDHRHTRCIWILKFVFNHHCLQLINVCLLICVCVFSLKEYAYILN